METKYEIKGLPFILVAVALALCTFMEVLDFSIANVSIPHIAGSLGVSDNVGTWVITLYMVGNAIVLPISGWLSEKIGPVRLILYSSILFGIASWFCGFATTFPMICISRFVQGTVAGPLIPVSQVLLVDIFPKGKKQMALALWAMVALVGPIAGPILGGWITQSFSWRWIFYINIPVAIFSASIIKVFMSKYLLPTSEKKLDVLGLFFLVIGITSLQILLDKGQQLDWLNSPVIRTLAVLSFVCIVALIIYEWNHPDPLIDIRLLKIRSFALGTFICGLSFMVFFSPIVITPLWLETFMGYTPFKAGAALATMGIIPFLTAPLVGRLMGTGRLKLLVGISFILMAIAFYYFSTLNTLVDFKTVAWSRFYLGFGLAPYIAPIISLSLTQVPVEKIARASGILQFFRIFMSGVGTSLYTTVWTNRATMHHERLVSLLTPYSERLASFKRAVMQKMPPKGALSLEHLNQLVEQQAYMIATNEVMLLSAMVLILLFFLLQLVNVSAQEVRLKGVQVGH